VANVTGPFETARQAAQASLWAIEGGPGSGMTIREANAADLEAATSGLTLGRYDREVLLWLAGWEPATVAVICGLIRRACA